MIDKDSLRRFRRFLLQFNDLRDFGFVGHDNIPRPSYTNETLAYFRNHPGEAFKEVVTPRSSLPHRVYRPGQVSAADIGNHLVTQGASTVFIINKANTNTLFLLADIDDKQGHGDAQEMAEYFRDYYLAGHGYIEHSRSGWGRHVYLLLDIEFVSRKKVREALLQWARLVRQDNRIQQFGAVFDRFQGLPTIWESNGGRQVIERRGNLLKIPYLPNDEDDLKSLQKLVPLSFNAIYSLILAGKTASGLGTTDSDDYDCCSGSGLDKAKGDIGVTVPEVAIIDSGLGLGTGCSGTEEAKGDIGVTRSKQVFSNDAFQRKLACVDNLLRATNGQATLQAVLEEYHRNHHPTGMTEEDIRQRRKKLANILERRRKTFQPSKSQSKPFRKGEFLDLVQRLVPDTAFQWERRDLLNHQRLADFVGVKIQDAFFQRNDDYFAAASRDATMSNMKMMQAKGLINWSIVPHQYTRLLQIAVEYGLLEVVKPCVEPTWDSETKRVIKGRARIIGPGVALPELRAEFQRRFEEWLLRQQAAAA